MFKGKVEHLERQISSLTSQFDYQGNTEPIFSQNDFQEDSNIISQTDLGYNQTPSVYYNNDKLGMPHHNKAISISQTKKSIEPSRNRLKLKSKGSVKESKRILSVRNGLERKSKYLMLYK